MRRLLAILSIVGLALVPSLAEAHGSGSGVAAWSDELILAGIGLVLLVLAFVLGRGDQPAEGEDEPSSREGMRS